MRKTHSTPGERNNPARTVMAVLLTFAMLFTTGCGDKPIELPEIMPPATQDTKPADTTPETGKNGNSHDAQEQIGKANQTSVFAAQQAKGQKQSKGL